jgi:hypothetical protein
VRLENFSDCFGQFRYRRACKTKRRVAWRIEP